MAVKMPDLGKMVGPLPLGAWILVVGGGLGFAYYTTRVSNEPEMVEDVGGVPGVGVGGSGMWTELPVPDSGQDDPEGPEITTNEQWARAVITFLIAQGYDASLADSAVRKYIVAGKLNAQEQALITLGLVRYGPPPIPLPPAENSPPPQNPDGDPETLAVPSGFNLDAKSWNMLLVDWKKVPGAHVYDVRRRGGKDRWGRSAINTITVSSRYRDTNLLKHTRYEYSVRARTITGKTSAWSPWWRTQTDFRG